MFFKRLIIGIAILPFSICLAFTINNTTVRYIYASLYTLETNAIRSANVYIIEPNETIHIETTSEQLNSSCYLVITEYKEQLPPILSLENFEQLEHYRVEKESQLYITTIDNKLTLCGTKGALSYIQENVFDNLHNLNEASIDFLHRLFSRHPHAHLDAHVRKGPELSTQEIEYSIRRKAHTKQALEKLLGVTLSSEQVPTIAFCFSGGGYRAMLATVGFLMGAESTGLLDTASYVSSLSGSTWAISLWHTLQSPISKVQSYLKKHIDKDLFKGNITINASSTLLLKKLLFGRKISLIDFYGGLLTERLLAQATNGQEEYLHNHASFFERQATLPYPIYTSVIAKPDNQYAWMEYTPHEIGSTYLNHFIPTWAFGRKFINGISTSRAQAEKLGFLLGIWGSAFSANIKEIYLHTKEDLKANYLAKALNTMSKYDTIGNLRLSCAQVRNFTYGILDAPMQAKQYLKLLDAGLDFNLPLPPLLRKERAVDIIVILDASACQAGEQLIAAENHAQQHNHDFPVIDKGKCSHTNCVVFKDTAKAPTIIYIPLIKNNNYCPLFDPQESCKTGYCKTSNFAYNRYQVNQLTGLTSHTLQESLSTITQEIASHIKNKQSCKP